MLITFAPTPHPLGFYLYIHGCFNKAKAFLTFYLRSSLLAWSHHEGKAASVGVISETLQFWSPFQWCPRGSSHRLTSGVWNPRWWEHLHPGNWQMLQIKACSLESWLVNICQQAAASDSERNEIHTEKRVHVGVNMHVVVWNVWFFLLCPKDSCNCPEYPSSHETWGGEGRGPDTFHVKV